MRPALMVSHGRRHTKIMRSPLVAVYADPAGPEPDRWSTGAGPAASPATAGGRTYAAFERSVATPPARLQAVTPRRASSRASVEERWPLAHTSR
jgi:hypothetical protein